MKRSLLWLLAALTVTLTPGLASSQGLPPGQNPYIYGMHDEPDLSLFSGQNSCAKGWVTKLRYIGDDGTCPTIDESALANKGYGVIMRLDHSGAPAPPPKSSQWTGYAQTFADCIRKSKGVSVWIVANEPNIPWGHPENRSFKPSEYGEIYHRVIQEVDKLQDSEKHHILFAAMAPWASIDPWGDWEKGMAKAIDYVRKKGTRIDAMSIHAYTKASYNPASISSDEKWPGRPNWYHHFRQYRNYTKILKDRNILDIPLYITESGNACDPPCDPYPDKNNGYWTAMFQEIHNWNQNNPRQRIRAITPYRWTKNDDGSGRDFCIRCSQPMRDDIANAVSKNWTWKSNAGCHDGMTCQPDCAGKTCGPDGCGGSCGTCAGQMTCQAGQCVGGSQDTGVTTGDTWQPPRTDTGQATGGGTGDTAIGQPPSADTGGSGGNGSGSGGQTPGDSTSASCSTGSSGSPAGTGLLLAALFGFVGLRRRR